MPGLEYPRAGYLCDVLILNVLGHELECVVVRVVEFLKFSNS